MSVWQAIGHGGTRWVRVDGDTWSADPHTAAQLQEYAGRPVELGPGLPAYIPTSDTDPVGLYLLVRWLLPGPVRVTGRAPAIPQQTSSANPDVVY